MEWRFSRKGKQLEQRHRAESGMFWKTGEWGGWSRADAVSSVPGGISKAGGTP